MTLAPSRSSADSLRRILVAPLLALCAGTVIVSVSAGQGEIPTGRLSPDACVNIALDRNYDMLISIQQSIAASGQAKSALQGVLPRLSADATYNHNQSRSQGQSVFGNVIVDDENRSESDSRSASLTLDQTLFNWSNWQTLKGARRNADASVEDVETQQLVVALSVKRQYYEYLKATKLHEVRIQSVELRESQLNRAQALFDVGSVARNDVLQAQVNLQQARVAEILARNQAVLEGARLAELMGLPVDTNLDIVDEFDVELAAEPDSAAVWSEAMQRRPDLRASELRVRASSHNLGSARAGRYPSLFLRASGNVSDSNTILKNTTIDSDSLGFRSDIGNEGDGWSVAAGLSWNIFDGMLTEGRVKESKASLSQSEDRLAQLQLSVALELKSALLGIRAANQSIEAGRQAVTLAAENTNLAEERYQLGSGTLLELEEAQVGLIEARRSLVESLALLKVAEATLDKAAGRQPR